MKNKVAIKFNLKDGSVFELDNPVWMKAFEMKIESEGKDLEKDWDEIHDAFVEKVDDHWRKKTVPTKFEWDESWEANFEDNKFWELYMKDHSVKQQYEEKYGKGTYPGVVVPPQSLEEEKKRLPHQVIIANDTEQAKYLDKLGDDHFSKLKKKAKEMAVGFKPFKNQVELAPKVMYQIIRVPIMGIMFSELTKGKGKVVGLGKDKQTIYSKDGFVQVGKNKEIV